MATETKIEWCHHTFNPWRGCTKVSAGCTHCYAETMSKRNPKTLGVWGDSGTRVVASEAMWREPLKWDKAAVKAGERRRVFCASLADWLEDRPELVAPRVRLYHLIEQTKNLDWLLLTKRIENYQRFQGGDGVPRSWTESVRSNVWLGVSVENQAAADERISLLKQTPAAVRFLSVEPLLGPVRLPFRYGDDPYHGDYGQSLIHQAIDWVIVGGESGPGARPCNVEWIRSIVRQCSDTDVACFVKQLGSKPEKTSGAGLERLKDPKGGDMEEWPADLRVRQFPSAEAAP